MVKFDTCLIRHAGQMIRLILRQVKFDTFDAVKFDAFDKLLNWLMPN